MVSLAVGISVLIVVSIIMYSVLFWFVELPVTNAKTETKIEAYCENIKSIRAFDDLHGGTLSTDLKMNVLTTSYTYLDNTSDNRQTESVENANYRVLIEYDKHHMTKIFFKDYNDGIVELFGTSAYTFGYWISDDGDYLRVAWEGDNKVTDMSEAEWQQRILEDFYAYTPYDSDGNIPYVEAALNNIEKITKKAYAYTIYASVENAAIELRVISIKDYLRFKLSVTECEYDDLGRVILEKTIYYEFSGLGSYTP